MLLRWKNQIKSEKDLSDFDLFECYKQCNKDCFIDLLGKYQESIKANLVKKFGYQAIIEIEDIFYEKVLLFLEKKKSEKKSLNKKENKVLKWFLVYSFVNHGFYYFNKKGTNELYLYAERNNGDVFEQLEEKVKTISLNDINSFLESLLELINFNDTQKEFLKLFCRGYEIDEIAENMNRSRSYTENIKSQIRKIVNEKENRETLTKYFVL
ncbi:MAG: hypothetical protein R2764_08285 [Bacteroidales bacterium]